MRSQCFIACYLIFSLPATLLCKPAHAWSECAHHIIAEIAYDLLDLSEQAELMAILYRHPRKEEDFTAPRKVADITRWRIGRAGYWPDVARGQPKYDRPSWHYQLGATLVIGDKSKVNVPDEVNSLSNDATLETQDLHIVQAIKLCRKVMADKKQPPGDRAIALCWLGHLVADIHQPCRAGSLYVEGVFPDGDRGANRIKTVGDNLHSLWDGLLGSRYDEGDVKRLRLEILNVPNLKTATLIPWTTSQAMKPSVWVEESRKHATTYVYTSEVLSPISLVSKGDVESLSKLHLSREYFVKAGGVAFYRSLVASYRLAEAWRGALDGDGGF